jgi:hypothetical protein
VRHRSGRDHLPDRPGEDAARNGVNHG